jgi:hypothetical protein
MLEPSTNNKFQVKIRDWLVLIGLVHPTSNIVWYFNRK